MHRYTEPVSDGEEDEDIDVAPARDEDKRTGLSGKEVADAIAFRERMLKERKAAAKANGKKPTTGAEEAIEEEEAEGDENTPFLRGRKDRGSTTSRERSNVDNRNLSIDPLAPSSAFDETLRERLRDESRTAHSQLDDIDEDTETTASVANHDDRVLSREWTAPSGKRIAVPVRVEPKVYFAAERTFLVCS